MTEWLGDILPALPRGTIIGDVPAIRPGLKIEAGISAKASLEPAGRPAGDDDDAERHRARGRRRSARRRIKCDASIPLSRAISRRLRFIYLERTGGKKKAHRREEGRGIAPDKIDKGSL